MLNAKLTSAISVCPVTKELNKNPEPNSLNEITFTNDLLRKSKIFSIQDTFSTRTANMIWKRIPFPTSCQFIALRSLLKSHAMPTKTASPSRPRKMDIIT